MTILIYTKATDETTFRSYSIKAGAGVLPFHRPKDSSQFHSSSPHLFDNTCILRDDILITTIKPIFPQTCGKVGFYELSGFYDSGITGEIKTKHSLLKRR